MCLNFSFLFLRRPGKDLEIGPGKALRKGNMTSRFDLIMFICIYHCAEQQNGVFKPGFSILRALKNVFAAL